MVVEVRPSPCYEPKERNMRKTIAVLGATAVIVGGAGTVALAASGTATPTASPSSSTSAAVGSASQTASETASGTVAGSSTTKPGRHKRGDRLRKAVHATWVSENKKTGTFTTHDAIRGRVTAVSPTSITVRAADAVSETYLLNPGTTVHTRGNKTKASVADVKTGDPVFVGGTGTTTLTAIRIIDAKRK